MKNNDLSKLFSSKPDPFEVVATPTSHTYEVVIDEAFEHISQFAQIVKVLEGATQNDIVQMRIGSPGGSVEAVLPLLTAMDNTEALIHVHVDSDCCSAATFPIMKADMVTFSRHASIMIHTASWGYGGHSGNMEASTNHFVKNIKALAHDLYDDFLTEEEFDKIFNGLDLWFTPEEVYERLKARSEKQQAEQEPNEDNVEEKLSQEEIDILMEQAKNTIAEAQAVVEKPKKPRTKKEE